MSVQRALKDRWLDGDFLVKNLSHVKWLYCSNLDWGAAEMVKLASALKHAHAKGALASLEKLVLSDNPFGNEGMSTLAKVITPDKYGKGPLASLKTLQLNQNDIRDDGLKVFLEACANGALAQCTKLGLWGNEISNVGMSALANALSNNRALLPKCEMIILWENDASVQAEHAVYDVIDNRKRGVPVGR